MKKILERIAIALEEIALGLNYLRRLENKERMTYNQWEAREKENV